MPGLIGERDTRICLNCPSKLLLTHSPHKCGNSTDGPFRAAGHISINVSIIGHMSRVCARLGPQQGGSIGNPSAATFGGMVRQARLA